MKKYKLGEIAKTSSGATPTSTKKEYYEGGTIPWINSGELSNPYIVKANNYITDLGFDNSSTKMYAPNDTVLLAMYGATAGKASLLQIEACTNQAICAIIPNKNIVEPLYLKYKLDTMYNYLVGLSTGSARDNLSQAGIANIMIDVPTVPIQQKICSVLSSLDRKIALNRAINRNLEALAKQLYDYWFVQFDFPDENGRPYKSSGGKMVWNEVLKREVPEGWEVKRLGEAVAIVRGKTITEKKAIPGNVKVVAAGLNFSYYHNQSNRTANCITVSGSGENAGFVNFWREPIFASDCSTIQFNDEVDTLLCYHTLKMLEHRFYKISHKSGQPHILPSDIAEIPMVFPDVTVKNRIRGYLINSSRKIGINTQEIERLTRQRDELLPLLMNGQVAIE